MVKTTLRVIIGAALLSFHHGTNSWKLRGLPSDSGHYLLPTRIPRTLCRITGELWCGKVIQVRLFSSLSSWSLSGLERENGRRKWMRETSFCLIKGSPFFMLFFSIFSPFQGITFVTWLRPTICSLKCWRVPRVRRRFWSGHRNVDVSWENTCFIFVCFYFPFTKDTIFFILCGWYWIGT